MFRREAVAHAQRRLTGDVVLAVPPSLRAYGILCAATAAVAAIFLCTATYARDETVTGWLVPHGGLIHVAAKSGVFATQIGPGTELTRCAGRGPLFPATSVRQP